MSVDTRSGQAAPLYGGGGVKPITVTPTGPVELVVLSDTLHGVHRTDPESIIARGRDLITNNPIDIDATDIGHEGPGFARNIGAYIPAVGLRK
jgi:hypothetical protein